LSANIVLQYFARVNIFENSNKRIRISTLQVYIKHIQLPFNNLDRLLLKTELIASEGWHDSQHNDTENNNETQRQVKCNLFEYQN
jgi:hypothetical protein